MNDKDLLLLLRTDPTAGLSTALELYGGTVKWIATKLLGAEKKHDIEECVAETFVKLWQGLDRFDAEKGTSLSAYINGISRHTALDFRRRQKKQTDVVSLESLMPDSEELGIDVDFTDELVRKTNAAIIKESIDALPPPDDEIFLFRYFLGLRVKEIAQRLGLSEKLVENRLYRGKTSLRDALIERGIIL